MKLGLFQRFWLTSWLVMTAALLLVVIGLLRWTDLSELQYLRSRPGLLIQEAAAELEFAALSGTPFDDLLLRSGWARVADLYLIDASGSDVLGRRLPDALRRWELSTAYGEATGAASSKASPPVLARAVYVPLEDQPLYLFALPNAEREQAAAMLGELRPPVLLVLSALFSAFCAWWLARSVIRPVKALEAASEQLAAGDFKVDLDAQFSHRGDEIARLATRFQRAFQQSFDALNDQRKLLRDVSHEIRSPLARMQVAAELLAEDPSNRAARERIVADIEDIDDLVGQLLKLSRSRALRDTGAALPSSPLLAALGAAAEAIELEAKRRGVRVACSLPQELASLQVPLTTLELTMVIDNLLRNALRHTPDGSTLTVEAQETTVTDKARIQFSVVDEGPGVPPEHLQHLFQPFWRLDESRARATGGFGLGLAIVAELVTKAGGEVVASNGKPAGLRVAVTLPLAVTASAPNAFPSASSDCCADLASPARLVSGLHG